MMSVFGVGIFAPAPKKRWCAPNLSGAHHFFRIRFAVVRGGKCGGYFTYFLPPLMTMPF